MAQYSRTPVVVEALQWDGTNDDAMNQFLASVTASIDVRWSFAHDSDHTEFIIRIQTIDGVQVSGDLTVEAGDWVVSNENSELVTYSDADFSTLYQAVP